MFKHLLPTVLCLATLFSSQGAIAITPQSLRQAPVAYEGRIRPLGAASRLWLADLYGKQQLTREDAAAAGIPSREALSLAWEMHLLGHKPWDSVPLIQVNNFTVKQALKLDPKRKCFSYDELRAAFSSPTHDWLTPLIGHHYTEAYYAPSNRSNATRLELTALAPGLWVAMREGNVLIEKTPDHWPWNTLNPGTVGAPEARRWLADRHHARGIVEATSELINDIQYYTTLSDPSDITQQLEAEAQAMLRKGHSSTQVAEALDRLYPLQKRLQAAGQDFRMLPDRHHPKQWHSLRALALKTYHPDKNQWLDIGNFTAFSDLQFAKLQRHYKTLIDESQPTDAASWEGFTQALHAGYTELQAEHPHLHLPSEERLATEVFYYSAPWPLICAVIYLLALLTGILAVSTRLRSLTKASLALSLGAFALHTAVLGMRVYILSRPPVANMHETLLYVPWIAVGIALATQIWQRTPIRLLAAHGQACLLLILLDITQTHSGLEAVQPVLDSQFWLIIHVLLVVASYGVFILSGILGHVYLVSQALNIQSLSYPDLAKSILHTLYIGTALLIPGTLLGGVWAAQSWGRFWDWDPKEAWAFISSCVYLICIHAYTFRKIKDLGLAVGSIAGLWAISFTWYGVNYILGTGLHSYGFGSGGESVYYTFLLADSLFVLGSITLITFRKRNSARKKSNTPLTQETSK